MPHFVSLWRQFMTPVFSTCNLFKLKAFFQAFLVNQQKKGPQRRKKSFVWSPSGSEGWNLRFAQFNEFTWAEYQLPSLGRHSFFPEVICPGLSDWFVKENVLTDCSWWNFCLPVRFCFREMLQFWTLKCFILRCLQSQRPFLRPSGIGKLFCVKFSGTTSKKDWTWTCPEVKVKQQEWQTLSDNNQWLWTKSPQNTIVGYESLVGQEPKELTLSSLLVSLKSKVFHSSNQYPIVDRQGLSKPHLAHQTAVARKTEWQSS